MLKVTFVSLEWPNTRHVGGVARYVYRLANELRSLVELTVVTFEGGQEIEGVRMVYIRPPRSRLDRFYRIPFVLRSTVRKIDADLIHAFGDDWALDSSKPVVRTFLGSALGEARSSRGLRKLNHYVLAITEALSARRARYRIAIGGDSNSQFNCHTIMPPVVPVLPPTEVAKTSTPSVIFIGSFQGRKRGNLVELAVEHASRATESNITLTVIGPASDAHSWSSSTVHIAGADDATVSALIAESWALMAPSLYEGFGIPVFEAMSLKTAVVASRNPGTEYIQSFEGTQSSLAIVDDANLSSALADRVDSGPHIRGADTQATQRAVQAILVAANPVRLAGEIYPKALF